MIGINPRSDAPTPASDDSSPADTANGEADTDDNNDDTMNNEYERAIQQEPSLPPLPRSMRSASMDAGPRLHRLGQYHNPPRRVIQSSPARSHGSSETEPIEIDLTPRPIRRQLFPSPQDNRQIRSDPLPVAASQHRDTHMPTLVRRSPRLNKTRDIFALGAAAVVEVTVDGKENINPAVAVGNDGLDDLFDDAGDLPVMPATPTPKRRSERLLLKTPSKTPQRHFGLEASSSGQALSHSQQQLTTSLRTPKAGNRHPVASALLGSVKQDLADMTPFTRSIHEALSDARAMGIVLTSEAQRCTSRRPTPKTALTYDFPDLPSLNDSPMSDPVNFNFSDLPTDHLNTDLNDTFSTDAPMPSSPPQGLFEFVNAHDDGVFGDYFNLNVREEDPHESHYPDPEEMSLVPAAGQTTRRSPRRRAH